MKEAAVVPAAEPVRSPEPEPNVTRTPPLPANHGHDLAALSTGGEPPDPASGRLTPQQRDALRAWIGVVAGQLGLMPGQVPIRLEEEPEWRVFPSEADGVASRGIIHLRSETFDPTSVRGRRLVAHEAAHVAQTLVPARVEATRTDVEREAEEFAEQVVSTFTASRVEVSLPLEEVAANTDFEKLVETVKQSRAGELARIRRLLGGLWISDGDVFDILQILGAFPPLTISAIARNLTIDERADFFNNLNSPHYPKHRGEILAVCYAAQSEKEFKGEDYQILNFISLADLSEIEALAVAHVVEISPKVREVAEKDPKRRARIATAEAFAKSDKAGKALGEALEESSKEEALEAARQARLKKEDKDLAGLAATIRAKLDEFHVSDAEALDLLDRIVVACLPFLDPTEKFLSLAGMIGDKNLDDLIEQIPVEGLYQSEKRRKAFVHLVAARPAYKNAKVVDDLMSSPWYKFWDTVTSEEAFTAYLLVKSMPPRARAAFLKARGGEKWGQIIDELPDNIRESESFNLYDGGEGQKDRQGMLAELLDDKIWMAGQESRLESMIRMARAAGEGEFVFEQSKVHRADKLDSLKGVVEKYKLYVEKKRETYEEPKLEGHAWYEEGLFAKLANFGRVLKLLAQYASDEVDLGVAHRLGTPPTFSDSYAPFIRGAHAETATKEQEEQAERAGKLPPNVIRYTDEGGQTDIQMSELDLVKLSLAGDPTIQAAPVKCEGLLVQLRYSPSSKKVFWLKAGFNKLTIGDCVIVSGGSMYSINSLELDNVFIIIRNESQVDDGNPALETGFAAMISPKTARGVGLRFSKMVMNGVATSAGTFVERVQINGLDIEAAGSEESYKDALARSANRLKMRIEEERKIETGDPEKAKEQRKKLAQLEKQLAKAEAAKEAGGPRGSVIDIQSVEISGVPGMLDEPLNLSDIHGQGTSVAAVVPIFADPTSIRQMVMGSEGGPTLGTKEALGDFSLDIAAIRNKTPLRIAGSIPTSTQAKEELDRFLSDNRTTRNIEGYRAVEKDLTKRYELAKEYEELAAVGIQNLGDKTERYKEVRSWLMGFEERRATIIETIALEGVTLNIGGDGNPELIADTLTLGGIRTFTPDGRESLRIGAVSGESVKVSAKLRGGLANYKEWRKALESGSLEADNLTIRDIRHAGSGAAIEEIAFVGETGAKGLEASFERGSQDQGGASIKLKSKKVIAKGVSIPAHRSLLKAEKERIEAIPEAERSTAERKRLKAIDEMLADLGRIEKSKQDAEDLAAKAKTKAQRAKAGELKTQSEAALKNWEDRLVVNRLTIDDLNISITGLGDVLAEDYRYDPEQNQVAISGQGGGDWFSKAEAEGIKNRTSAGDQVLADKITAGPVSGTLKPTKTGFILEEFKVASLVVQGVSYVSGDMKVQAIGETTLHGIAIDATIDTLEDRQEFKLTKVDIGRIVANDLRYEDADKRITVKSGELVGLHLREMHIVLPDDKKQKKSVTGKVSLDELKSLALSGVAGGYQADVSVNAAKPAGEEAHALEVDFAKSGEVTVAIKGLNGAANIREVGKPNKVYVEWKNLSGAVVVNGDKYTFTGVQIGNVQLSAMQWTIGAKSISIDDKVTLKGVEFDLEAALTPKKKSAAAKPAKETATSEEEKGKEPEKELTTLYVKRLGVNEIAAKDVSLTIPEVKEDKAKGIEASQAKHFHLKQATVKGLKITGFDVLNMKGKVEVAKELKVTDLRTTIGDIAKGNFVVATTSLHMFGKEAEDPAKGGRELSATLLGEDGTIIKLGRTDSLAIRDIWASSEKTTKKKGKETIVTTLDSISLAGITTGDLIIKPEEVSISDIEIAGPIAASNLRWSVIGTGGKLIIMETATAPDVVKITRIYAKFKRTPTGKIVDGKEQYKSEMTEAGIAGLDVPKVIATRFRYNGPMESKEGFKTVDLEIPQATIEGIKVHSLTKDFAAQTLQVDAIAKSASADNVAVTMITKIKETVSTKKFITDVKAGGFTAKAIFKTRNAGTEDEKTEIDSGYLELDDLGLKKIMGTLGLTGPEGKKKDERIGYGAKEMSADAKKIRYDKDGVTIASTSIKNVSYWDPNTGVTAEIDEVLVPSTMSIPNKGPITIPEGTITKAHVVVDNVMALGSGGGGGGTAIDKQQFYDMLDRVNGTFKARVFAPIFIYRAGYDWYLRQDEFPVNMVITNGKFRYLDVFDEATWIRNDMIASLQMDTDSMIVGPSGDLEWDWSQAYLTLEVGGSNQLEWTPGSDTERAEMMRGDVRLKRIISPDNHKTKEEEEKEEEERIKAGEPKTVEASRVELRGVDADLGLSGQIPLDLGEYGRITLGGPGKDAVTGLKATSSDDDPLNKLKFTLEQAVVGIEQLNISGTKIKGAKGGNAEIVINGVDDGSLTFANGKVVEPRRLEATVASATVKNLAVDLGE